MTTQPSTDDDRPHGLTRADIMTAREVADMLGVPVSTILHWGRTGILPRVKLGRHVRFIRTLVEHALIDGADTTR